MFKFSNFLVRTLACTEKLDFFFYGHENMKNPPSKVSYFSKKKCSSILPACSAPKEHFCLKTIT